MIKNQIFDTFLLSTLVAPEKKVSTFAAWGKSCATSSHRIPQGRNTARVDGCSGAT